ISFPSSKSQNTGFKCDRVSKAIDAEKLIDYNALKTCFESIPFNAKNADKVFDDTVNPSNNDCEVIEIEGKPALQAIKDFANKSISQSKDLGVRFNMALAPITGLFSQQFTSRIDMPETSSITYKLSCSKKKPFLLKRKWEITFDGGVDFFDNVCLNLNSKSTSFNDNVTSSNKNEVSTSSDKVTKLNSRDKFEVSKLNKNKPKIAHAKLIFSSDADFYLLNDDENIGVAVIDKVEDDVESSLQFGFEEFKKRKVKKIVLDFSNNDGGSVTVPLFINSILFSSKQPNSYPTRININDLTVPVIKSNFKTEGRDVDDFYNPNFYLTFPEGGRFNSADQFILGSRKNRTSNLYLNALTSDELELIKDTPHFPWTSDDFIILTNGYCASACALTTLFFSEFHKVETIAVGGLLGNNLSFCTYPGGEFTSSNVILEDAGDDAADVQFPNSLFLPVRKAISFFKNGTEKEVLEYSYRPADHRFYYNETNAKDPSILWVEAAKILNKEKS
ncbi:147_t:CDS:2, partial [Cetraspora pellucida]